MYDATQIPIPRYAERLFNVSLLLYPEAYRKKFGQEMRLVFTEIYHEEYVKNGKVGFGFWLSQIGDITKSVIEQHIDDIGKKGMKKYLQQTLHINTYNIISIVFLLPVILMTGVEVISRIAQRDLTHYNRSVYVFFSHTFLYWNPVLFTWVIIFPVVAAVISLVPLFKSLIQKKVSPFSWNFVKSNFIGIAILLFGLGFLALIKLHDFMPCMFYGLTHFGFGQLNHTLSVCSNA